MEREQINVYIEPLLNLVPSEAVNQASDIRSQLIEEAVSSDDFEDLVRQWLAVHDQDETVALRLKTWFSLSYSQLGRILNLSAKDVSQVLRGQRTQHLPTYPPVSKSLETATIGGLSCFMVEQSLSAWIDSEVQDSRQVANLQIHLNACGDCRDRLAAYRQLHQWLLHQRQSWPSVTELEWNDALRTLERRRKKFIQTVLFYVGLAALIGLIAFGFFWSQPIEAPNIYEIGR